MSKTARKKTSKKKSQTLKTFDMYHFFSRLDVVLAIALLLGFLLGALYFFFTGHSVA